MSTYIIVRNGNYASLSHHGVKGMKWGVRKQYPNRNLRAAAATRRDAEDLRRHGYNKEADAVMKISNKQRQKGEAKLAKKNKNRKDVSTYLKKEQKPVQKYSNKAEKQVSYLKNEEKMFRGKFDSLSPAEKRRERKRFTESGKWAAKNAKYWDKAAKDISMSTSGKQAKEKFKKYRQNAEIYVVNP